MENIFQNLEAEAPAEVVTDTANAVAKEAKKQKEQEMRAYFAEKIQSDPSFKEKLGTLSNSLEVVNTLGFGDNGNIVVDKTKTEDRNLAATSVIVGYRIKNIGKAPIKYKTEIFAQDADGRFVGSKTEKTLAPNGVADLTRQYMTMLCAQPEISFQLANGKIVRGSAKGDRGIKAALSSFYFAFDKKEGEVRKQVNDDTVKLNVGEKVGGKWVVKKEFVPSFGYLNNSKETAKRGGKAKGDIPAQIIAANYINKLIEQAGL